MENIAEKTFFHFIPTNLKIYKPFAKKAWTQKKKKKNDFNYIYYSSLHLSFVFIWCVKDLVGLEYISYF